MCGPFFWHSTTTSLIAGCVTTWEKGRRGMGQFRVGMIGYAASPEARIVALADIDLEHVRVFQAEHGGEQLYADYRGMPRIDLWLCDRCCRPLSTPVPVQ